MLDNIRTDYWTPPRAKLRIGYSNNALVHDLDRVHERWLSFQASKDRDSVYKFLKAVFELVQWWSVESQATKRARIALEEMGIKVPEEVEPFTAVIIATAYPDNVDRRTVSKWSRVLRYAAKFKRQTEGLTDFIKRRGGLNACASRYACLLGRWAENS
jgi:hypothetical protein